MVRLPQPFRKIIHNTYNTWGYNIVEAYVDESEWPLKNGLQGLRAFLGLNDSESVCDCYCMISAQNYGKIGILFEDKKSRDNRDFTKAIKQLGETCSRMQKQIDFAVICRYRGKSGVFNFENKQGLPGRLVIIKAKSETVTIDNNKRIKLLVA